MILIVFLLPYPFNFFLLEFVSVILIRIAVLILNNIYKGGIILIADIILDSKIIKLVEQYLDFPSGRIIFTAGINDCL